MVVYSIMIGVDRVVAGLNVILISFGFDFDRTVLGFDTMFIGFGLGFVWIS